MAGSLQHFIRVLAGEVRSQLGDSGDVETAIGQHGQENRVLTRGPRRGDAQIRLGLREMKDLRAVGEHRGGGFTGIKPSRVDFADVGYQVGFEPTGLSRELAQATEQLIIRDRSEWVFVFHAENIGPAFLSLR